MFVNVLESDVADWRLNSVLAQLSTIGFAVRWTWSGGLTRVVEYLSNTISAYPFVARE